MAVRRTIQDFRNLGGKVWTALGVAIGIVTVVGGIALGLTAAGDAINTSGYDDARNARVHLNQALSADMPMQTRIVDARALIRLHKAGVKTDIDNGSYGKTTTEYELRALQEVVATGKPLSLDTHHYRWLAFHNVLSFVIAFWVLAYLQLWFVVYALNVCQPEWGDYFFLVDLPYRRIWPFALLALTPLGWPFYLVSALRMHKVARPEEQPRPVPAPVPQPMPWYDDLDGYYDFEFADRRRRIERRSDEKLSEFAADSEDARARYIELREQAWKSGIVRRRRNLRKKLKRVKKRMQALGEEIRRNQATRNSVEAELRELNAIDVDHAEPDRERIVSEFDRLLALPGIAGIRMVDGDFSLLLKARMEWGGERYDLGDWELRFGAHTGLVTHELRSGVKPTWRGTYPVYRLGGGYFCFGGRDYIIRNNLLKGQYLEAIELAVDSMQSVNERDAPYVPEAFEKAEKEMIHQ